MTYACRLLLALTLMVGAALAQACELRVRRHPDALTLVRLPSGEVTGPQLETVREALRRMGCRMQVLPLPWARALADLASGDLDVLPGAHRLPERETYAHFSTSPWPSRNRLFMRSRSLREQGQPADLKAFLRHQRLGLQIGVAYGATLDTLLQQPELAQHVIRVPSRNSLWQMLAMGRIDGLLADDLAGPLELRRLALQSQLSATQLVLDADPSHTAFNRRTVDAALVARFDATMQAMERDGTRAKIEKRFAPLMGR